MREALAAAGEVEDLALVDQAATPLLVFSMRGLSVDLVVNQMGSIRDLLLFRYTLRSESPDLIAGLRLIKCWLRRRRLPALKQGGFPALVWMRMAVRYYQEHVREVGTFESPCDWVPRFMVWAREGLPSGQASLTIQGEQIWSNAAILAAGVPEATLLLLSAEISAVLEAPSELSRQDIPAAEAHANLCRVEGWGRRLAVFYVSGVAEALGTCRRWGPSSGRSEQVTPGHVRSFQVVPAHARSRCCRSRRSGPEQVWDRSGQIRPG